MNQDIDYKLDKQDRHALYIHVTKVLVYLVLHLKLFKTKHNCIVKQIPCTTYAFDSKKVLNWVCNFNSSSNLIYSTRCAAAIPYHETMMVLILYAPSGNVIKRISHLYTCTQYTYATCAQYTQHIHKHTDKKPEHTTHSRNSQRHTKERLRR